MAAPSGEFATLLRALRGAGPLDRLSVLAKGVGVLRRLSPSDRKILLKMAGFDGAEALVERLAHDDRRMSRALRQLLGKLEENPAAATGLGQALADPRRRGKAIDDILSGLESALDEPTAPPAAAGAAAPTTAAAPAPTPVTAQASQPPPAPPEPPSRPVPPAPPAPQPTNAAAPPPAAEPERAAGPEPPAEPAATKDEAAASAAEPTPPRPPSPPSPAPRSQEGHPRGATTADRSSAGNELGAPWDTAPLQAFAPAPSRRSPLLGASRTDPPAERSLRASLRGLRELRTRIAAGEALGADTLAPWLEDSQPSWLRRRALQSWLAALPAGELTAALRLVDRLPTPTARYWCLSTLAGDGAWTADQWSEILDHAPSPGLRRRLELRRRR